MLDLEHIHCYRENNRLEAKLATGGLPQSIWETYSAFANTYGGVILLGVEELSDHSLRIQGLLHPEELVQEFWDQLTRGGRVSSNILTQDQIWVAHTSQGDIVVIEVPPAPLNRRPVYLGSDPFTGSYRRAWDGDFHCTRAEVATMLGEQKN